MLEIRIGYGDMVSEQMRIPMSASDFEAAKKILDEGKAGNQTVTVRSLVSPVQPLSEVITGLDYGDEMRRKELDFLDSRLRHMTRKEQDIFSVALKLETPGTLKEIINLSYNLDSYDLLEDISDPGRIAAELLRRGKQIEIPEALYPMLDFERIRDSYFADHKGDYCPSGLVLKREDTVFTEVYRNKVLDYGYDYFTPQKANVSYPIAALNPAYEVLISGRHSNNFAPISSDTKENQLCNLKPEQLLKCFDVTLEALDKALKFIDDNRLKKYNRSDYVNNLIGYFVFHREEITDKQKKD